MMNDRRLAQLLSMIETAPDDTFLLFALAKEYEGGGQDADALAHYLRLREVDANYVGLYYHLGKLYERIGQAGTAFETYKQGMAIAKALGDRHAYSELAGAKLNLGDDDDEEDDM